MVDAWLALGNMEAEFDFTVYRNVHSFCLFETLLHYMTSQA